MPEMPASRLDAIRQRRVDDGDIEHEYGCARQTTAAFRGG
jgi:hypothetical protein